MDVHQLAELIEYHLVVGGENQDTVLKNLTGLVEQLADLVETILLYGLDDMAIGIARSHRLDGQEVLV